MMAEHPMRAVRIYGYGGPEQLKFEWIERPAPQAGEVLLRVHASRVNAIDWKIRLGLMKDFQPITFPSIPGIEVAGVVDYTTTAVESVVQHVDLVVNGVGGETFNSSLAALRRGGTLIALAGPPPREQAKAKGVRATRIHAQPSHELLQRLACLIDEGRLRAVVGKTFLLREAPQAHEYGQRGHGRGRIVLQIADERDDEGHRPVEEREMKATRKEIVR